MTIRRNGNGILIGGGALLAGVLTFGVVLGKTLSGGAADPALPALSDAGAVVSTSGSAEGSPATSPVAVEGTSTDLTSGAPAATPSSPVLSPSVLDLAVDRAPFQEDRQRPMTSYRLPGDEPPPVRAETPPPPPAPDFQLVGAVSGPSGSWAIVRVGDGEPQMVAVGESMEGYTLSNVRGDRVMMASADRTVSLSLAGPSPEVAPPPRNQGRGGNQGRGNQQNQGNAGRPAIELSTSFDASMFGQNGAAVLEQLQSQGINPTAIMQQLGRGGNPSQIIQRIQGAIGGQPTVTTTVREFPVPNGGRGGGGNGR